MPRGLSLPIRNSVPPKHAHRREKRNPARAMPVEATQHHPSLSITTRARAGARAAWAHRGSVVADALPRVEGRPCRVLDRRVPPPIDHPQDKEDGGVDSDADAGMEWRCYVGTPNMRD